METFDAKKKSVLTDTHEAKEEASRCGLILYGSGLLYRPSLEKYSQLGPLPIRPSHDLQVSEPQLLLLENTSTILLLLLISQIPYCQPKKKSQTPRRVGDQHIQYFHSQ